MRKILLFIAVPFVFLSALSAQTERESTNKIVLEYMSTEEQPHIIYAKGYGPMKSAILTTSTGEMFEIDYPAWIYYVRYANIASGRYLIVKENNGNILEIKAKNDIGPNDLMEEWWRIVEKTSKEEFCSYVNSKNIHKTIPLINEFLIGVSKDLDDEQKMQILIKWLKSHSCIYDATILCTSCIKTLPLQSEIIVSFLENSMIKHLVLDISMGDTLEAICYHETGFDVDSMINIRVMATIEGASRNLQFYCSTAKIYPCCNYPILVEKTQSLNNIDIAFNGVLETEFCLTAIGPATAIVNLGELSNGTYNLNLFNGDRKCTGELIVTSDSYEVNFAEDGTFLFTNTPLNKTPEHTIWGMIGYHELGTLPLVQSFLAELMDLGAEKKSYNPGYYQEFRIDKNGDIITPDMHGYWFAQSFIFNYSGNIADVEQLVKQYARDHGAEMSIRVYSDTGDSILSWMY